MIQICSLPYNLFVSIEVRARVHTRIAFLKMSCSMMVKYLNLSTLPSWNYKSNWQDYSGYNMQYNTNSAIDNMCESTNSFLCVVSFAFLKMSWSMMVKYLNLSILPSWNYKYNICNNISKFVRFQFHDGKVLNIRYFTIMEPMFHDGKVPNI